MFFFIKNEEDECPTVYEDLLDDGYTKIIHNESTELPATTFTEYTEFIIDDTISDRKLFLKLHKEKKKEAKRIIEAHN